MKRPPFATDNDSLFDLPLDGRSYPAGSGDSSESAGSPGPETPPVSTHSDNSATPRVQPELPLGPTDSSPPGTSHTAAPPTSGDSGGGDVGPSDPVPPVPGIPTLGQRLAGGGFDLAAHLGMLLLAILGSWWLGVPPSRLSLLPFVLFASGFSFIYHVLPLVFWGHTPGMARCGLVARSVDGGPLTIGQAVRRWMGALLSVATLGLPLAFGTERTLSDRLSGSTVRA